MYPIPSDELPCRFPSNSRGSDTHSRIEHRPWLTFTYCKRSFKTLVNSAKLCTKPGYLNQARLVIYSRQRRSTSQKRHSLSKIGFSLLKLPNSHETRALSTWIVSASAGILPYPNLRRTTPDTLPPCSNDNRSRSADSIYVK